MADLRIGDRVLAVSPEGALEYQDVYFFGHREPAKVAPYLHITTASGRALRLSPDHYLPAAHLVRRICKMDTHWWVKL